MFQFAKKMYIISLNFVNSFNHICTFLEKNFFRGDFDNVPVKLKLQHPPPPGKTRAFDCESCLGRGEFERCLGRVGNLVPNIWFQTSGLVFNEAKCRAQRITRKTKPIMSTYKLNNILLGTYAAEKDLGVWITNDLTWNKQIYEQSARANGLLGYIKRNTRFILGTTVRLTLFLGLVRPHLGYAT